MEEERRKNNERKILMKESENQPVLVIPKEWGRRLDDSKVYGRGEKKK